MEFNAEIKIIGINPYVDVPDEILTEIFRQAGKNKGHIPICGTVNGKPYKQTLVKYSGQWRLYINTVMLKDSPRRIGEIIEITVEHDTHDRSIEPHPELLKAFAENPEAKMIFDTLAPSRQNEIIRYISHLKTQDSIAKNIKRTIAHLSCDKSFAGRNKAKQS